MKDALLLRDRMAAALLCAPFATAACAKTQTSTETSTSPPAETGAGSAAIAASAATSTDAAVAERAVPHRPNFPQCPHGEFCAPAAKMKAAATADSKTAMGCPIDVKSSGDGPESMPPGPGLTYRFAEETTKAKQAAGDKTACCYTWVRLCPGGRPLLDDGEPTTAPVRDGESWIARRVELEVPDDAATREALAAAWLNDACMEHASIASFARTTLELLSVGAPPDLIRDAQRAALDEVRHAERCFELASFYGGRPREPGPLPALAPRAADPARLAHDTFLEGCVGETISALAATRAAEGSPGPVAVVWRMLAADETRHAALAWRTLAWLVNRDPLARAPLRTLASSLGADLVSALPTSPALPGRLSSRDLDTVRADALRAIILPTLEALLS